MKRALLFLKEIELNRLQILILLKDQVQIKSAELNFFEKLLVIKAVGQFQSLQERLSLLTVEIEGIYYFLESWSFFAQSLLYFQFSLLQGFSQILDCQYISLELLQVLVGVLLTFLLQLHLFLLNDLLDLPEIQFYLLLCLAQLLQTIPLKNCNFANITESLIDLAFHLLKRTLKQKPQRLISFSDIPYVMSFVTTSQILVYGKAFGVTSKTIQTYLLYIYLASFHASFLLQVLLVVLSYKTANCLLRQI